MTSLLQEIISVYPLLNPSQLTAAASNRVCNALALLQCVASHNETRALFLSGNYSLYHGMEITTNEEQHTSLFSFTPFSTQPRNHGRLSIFDLPHWGSSVPLSRMTRPK